MRRSRRCPPWPDLPGPPIQIGHKPISADGFTKPVWLARQPLTAHELEGYYTYRRLTEDPAERADETIRQFNAGLTFSDAGQPHEAIGAYTLAHTLILEFFEAVGNRAFCRMNLGDWPGAITDFQKSLRISYASDLAEFSISKCCYKLGDDARARARFKQALALNPASELARELLAKVAARSGA